MITFLKKQGQLTLRIPKALRPTTPGALFAKTQDAVWLGLADLPSSQFIQGNVGEVAIQVGHGQIENDHVDLGCVLLEDLEIARSAGLDAVEVFWREYREVVYGGPVRKN